ncbi:glycoside hydrolase family 125 protein [Rhodanobacter sp. C05]|uniref:glycoside hydrolase family 125 protein n=1 Tax=Rhodanobacter sp. C05 TaxID=1945855 RepID=UPI0009846AAF|nr:glycoside hydrolase family 125 protein [Rhodanobacter sp. C05]OOG41618.1 metal-independent alpha-mannosidase [Rhodanobacter sp. C05]
MPTRRDILKWFGAAAASGMVVGLIPNMATAGTLSSPYVSKRPPVGKRKFVSAAVERQLATVKSAIGDPKLAWMFENCYPNTLDTTVELGTLDGKPDTFVITGDIDAMWLRDSSAQVVPYIPLAKNDSALQRLFRGLIRRQARCIRIDPYANAFMPDPHAPPLIWAQHDSTDMKPGVGERKWEIDSLCYPIRMAHAYWQATGDTEPFDDDWRTAMRLVLQTFREQQRKHGRGPYHFQRTSEVPTETQFLDGYGNPTRPNGMIHSMFRPSDDACVYPLFVPSNLFAVVSLRQLAQMGRALHHDDAFASDCEALANEVEQAVRRDGRMRDADGRVYWAYEIDGFGNQLFMDDANAPGLLSLAYLGCCDREDPAYRHTRDLVWSARNPYFFKGRAAEGIGGPHEGLRMIWPMSIMMYAQTSDDQTQIRQCLTWLRDTDAGTGFMHEAFDQDNPSRFTRGWFAWANTLFGELIVDVYRKHPELLRG